MRVLFATKPHFPIVGGAQITTHSLAVELERRGHRVMALASQDPRRAPLPTVDWSTGYLTLRTHRPEPVLPRVLVDFRPDVVVVGGYHAETAAWARSMLIGAASVPTVLHLHDHATAPLAGERDLRIDFVAAVSDFVARQARSHGASATSVPPIVERRHYRVDSDRRVALFVNPVPQKGLETALALARARPDIPFAFTRCWYLAPPALEALHAEARRLGNVDVRPPEHDPAAIYGDARVLLAPSTYPEAWARVVSEAQMSGIPALASNVGGLPEAVGGGGILLKPDAGARAWTEALARLWDDETAYARHSSLAEEHGLRGDLEPDVVGDRFESLLATVAGRA